MAVVENPNRLVHFGVFELDTKAGELRRNGSKVRLQEQPLQVLLVLLEQPGEIVSREELRKRLWPGDTFVDFDHSLNAAIRRLRDALGDSAENPRFVETVARRGYRFLAPVNGVSPAATAVPTVPHKIAHAKWLAVGAGLLVAAVVLGWWIGRHRTSGTAAFPSLQRLTANAAEAPVLGGAISPDGKYLAFADKTGFYLRQIATGETHSIELPSGFDARPASWFPDGTHLVATWAATPNDPAAIWNISILGGAPRKLADAGLSPAVSPDGSQIAYLVGGSLSRAIWVMQADGSNPHQVRERDGGSIGGPRWSPDGKYLIYVAGKYHAGAQYVDAQVEALNLASGNQHVVLSTARLFHSVIWTNKNKLIYAAGERPPNQDDANLWELQIDPDLVKPIGSPRRLTSDPGYVSDFSATADGTRLAFFKHTIQPDIYVANIESGGDHISTPSRLTLDERQDFPSAWTRDGKSILFMSDRDGTFHIFRQAIDRGSPDLLVGGNEQLVIPRLTPDGSTILYLISSKWEQRPMNVRMMRIPVDGGAPQNVLSAPEISNHQCAVVPATLCLYSTIDEHEIRFYRFDPFTGSAEALPKLTRKDEDFYSFNWSLSPNGRTLAMAKKLSMDQAAVIRLISIGDNKETVLPVPGWAFLNSLDWSTDGKSVWVSASTTQDSSALLNVRVNGQVRTALEDKKMKIGWAIQSLDGKRVAMWEASGASNVWMLEGL